MYKNVFATHAYPLVAAFATIIGMGGYFLSPIEPSVSIGVILSIASVVLLVLFRHQRLASLFFVGVLFGSSSFTYATFYSQNLQTVFLPQALAEQQVWVRGKITDIWPGEKRSSLTLEYVKIYGLEKQQTPHTIKVSLDNKRAEEFRVGHWVAAQVVLQPPRVPQFKGDYDQQRSDYFNGIGARGYVMGSIYPTWVKPEERYDTLSVEIQRVRSHISDVLTQDGSQESALVSALLTGIKGRIAPEVYDSFRHSGLAHLLAISGLHLALFGGFIFVLLRRLLCLWPALVLKYSSKKMAAIGALVATFGYMLLAGGTIPTIRAFIMIGLLFAAILFTRIRMSLRALCVAVIAVLFLYPESVMSVSFQMSFVAVFALILWNEYREGKAKTHLKLVGFLDYVKATAATALIAGLATMPIVAWHFGEVSIGGFLANILAVPLTALWIMPCGLAILLFMPLGWHQPFQSLMETGTGLLMDIAAAVAAMPYSHFAVSTQIIGFLWLGAVAALSVLFMPRYWRHIIVGTTVGMFAVVVLPAQTAQITWLAGGEVILLNTEQGVYPLYAGEQNQYILERYVARHNLPLAPDGTANCDSLGCVFSVNDGSILALEPGMLPTQEDCVKNTLILPLEMNVYCGENYAQTSPFLYAEGWLKNNQLHRKTYMANHGRTWQLNL